MQPLTVLLAALSVVLSVTAVAAQTTLANSSKTTAGGYDGPYLVAVVTFKRPMPHSFAKQHGEQQRGLRSVLAVEERLQHCVATFSSPAAELVAFTPKMLVARQPHLAAAASTAASDSTSTNVTDVAAAPLRDTVRHCLAETFELDSAAGEDYEIATTVWDLKREEETAARTRATAERRQQEQAGNFIPFQYATSYGTVEAVYSRLRRLEQPSVCNGYAKVFEFGRSINNEPLLAVRISTNPTINDPVKHEHVIVGAHHAREWISVEVSIAIAEMYCALMTTNTQIATLAVETELIVAPITNVDGYRFTFEPGNDPSGVQKRFWRKNRHFFNTTSNPMAIGVDLNRNYPFQWLGDGSSPYVFVDTYRGPSAASEPEVQAVMRLMTDATFASKVTSFVSFHSYGQLVLYPWGYTTQASPARYLAPLADMMSQTMGKVPGGVRYTAKSSADLYPVNGDTKDWVHDRFAYIPAFTIEARPRGSECCGFELPTDKIPATVNECAAATFYLMKYAHLFRKVNWLSHTFPAASTLASWLPVDKNANNVVDYMEVDCAAPPSGASGSEKVTACWAQADASFSPAVQGVRYVYVTRLTGPVALSEVRVYNGNGANVAQGRTATQSSTFSGNVASLAVDGSSGSGILGLGCSYTGPISFFRRTRWWRVDLGSSTDVLRSDVYRCSGSFSLVPSMVDGAFLVYVDADTKVLAYRPLNWSLATQSNMVRVTRIEMTFPTPKYMFFLDPFATYASMSAKCPVRSFTPMAMTRTESELNEVDEVVGGVADVALGGYEASPGVWKWSSSAQTFFNNGVCLQSYCPDATAFVQSWAQGTDLITLDPLSKKWIASRSGFAGGYVCLGLGAYLLPPVPRVYDV